MYVISSAEREVICAWKAKLFKENVITCLEFSICSNHGNIFTTLGPGSDLGSQTGWCSPDIIYSLRKLVKEFSKLPNSNELDSSTIVKVVATELDITITVMEWDGTKYV